MRKGQTTTAETTPDAGTADWIQQYRQAAAQRYAGTQGMEAGLGGIEQFTNPHEASVISGIQGDYDRQRGQASLAAADMATKQGAFGGSRSAVLQAGLLGDVNRDEASTLANVRQSGFNTAAERLLAQRRFQDERQRYALGGMERGLGYGGSRFSQTGPESDAFQENLGLLLQLGGMFAPGPKKVG